MRGHAEVVGAGLAGLSLAVMLGRAGWTVRVHEAETALRAAGGGLYILDEGIQALRALGVYGRFAAIAWAPVSFETRLNGERSQFQVNDGQFSTMRRQDLHDILSEAALRAGVEVTTGSRVAAAGADGALLMEDGTRRAADLVVAADGVRSRVSEGLGIGQDRRRYPEGLLRALVNRQALRGSEWDGTIDFWSYGPRPLRILYSPCSATECYLALMAPEEDAAALALPLDVELWSQRFPALTPLIRTIGDRARFDRYGTIRLDRWSSGKVAIIGDAAHAMPSSRGQGANIGIGNAVALANYVDAADDLRDALERWETERRPRIEAMQREAENLVLARALTKGRPNEEPKFIPGTV